MRDEEEPSERVMKGRVREERASRSDILGLSSEV